MPKSKFSYDVSKEGYENHHPICEKRLACASKFRLCLLWPAKKQSFDFVEALFFITVIRHLLLFCRVFRPRLICLSPLDTRFLTARINPSL